MTAVGTPGGSVDEQAQEQTGKPQIRLRIDDRGMNTTYTNAFRSHASADEVMLDFGINTVVPARGEDGAGAEEVHFDIANRMIINYYTAKRLALMLSNLVRQHEERFGELKLNVADRVKHHAAP